MTLNSIYNEDCLIGMSRIPDKTVDMILCDLPYGTTACKWDMIIPLEPLWDQYERVVKVNGAIVLFAASPFNIILGYSNIANYKYSWYWDKSQCGNFQLANRQPLKNIEEVLVFSFSTHKYYPQGLSTEVNAAIKRRGKSNSVKRYGQTLANTSAENEVNEYRQLFTNYPKCLIEDFPHNRSGLLHPTQKPVALFEYLIKTYTNESETVLDNCMGSGTTAIACINTGRNYIGFEKEEKYYQIAQHRIKNHIPQLKLKYAI